MIKQAAIAFGAVLLLVGILGFINAVTPGIADNNGMLLGIFHVNMLHNVIHVVTGLIALAVGFTSLSASRTYFQVFGVVYALVAVLGLVYGSNDILGLVASNLADTLLHIAIAAASLYLGFGMPAVREPVTA